MAPNFAGIKAHNTHRQTSDQQCKCVLSRSQVYVPYVVSLAGFSHLSVACSMEKGLAGAFFFSQVRSGYVERVYLCTGTLELNSANRVKVSGNVSSQQEVTAIHTQSTIVCVWQSPPANISKC